MMLHLLTLLLCWLSTNLIPAQASSDQQLPIPFLLKQDDNGGVVAIIYYGSGQGMESKTIRVQCEDTPFKGPGTIDCVPNHENDDPNSYTLIVPFFFVYNEHQQIIGVDFNLPTEPSPTSATPGTSSNLMIPFHVERDPDGNIIGVRYDEQDYGVLFRLPWTTKKDENGTPIGIQFDTSSSTRDSLGRGQVAGVVAGSLLAAIGVVLLGYIAWNRKTKQETAVLVVAPPHKQDDDEATQVSEV